MDTAVVIAYWIAGALGLLYALIMLFAVLKILKVLQGIAETIPQFRENQATKYVQDTLKMGYIENQRKLTESTQILSKSDKDDSEVRDLINRINELKKQNED